MKCPNCNVNLVMADRNGVEIDYCPECRGVWLDRGELDKIIERSSQYNPSVAPAQNYDRKYTEPSENEHRYKKKRKGSFLDDLFDF